MTQPNNLFRTMSGSTSDVLLKMMENIYTYGRAHWTWEATTGREGSKCYDESSQVTVQGLSLIHISEPTRPY